MTNETLDLIDMKIDKLILDNKEYSFNELKKKIENMLQNVDLFLIEGQVNQKAIDMYLKSVINKRNKIKSEKEKKKLEQEKKDKYKIIEEICKKLDFNSKEELLKTIEKLEKKTMYELENINKSS